MWAIVINPISGGGRGAVLGREVAGYFAAKKLSYSIITATSSPKLRSNLVEFLNSNIGSVEGVISVGGDGLAHLVLQVVVPRRIPFSVVAGGTGNDFLRAIGWELADVTTQLDAVTTQAPRSIDLGLVDSEWFGAILSTGFDSVVNEKANTLKWPRGPMKYNVAIAMELPKFKPLGYQIEIDGKRIETESIRYVHD